MITKTTLKAVVASGGVIATWLAVGPTQPAPEVAQRAQRAVVAHETTAEELNVQADKLRGHLNSGQLRPSTRNPFRFGTGNPAGVPHAPAVSMARTAAALAPVAIPAPDYTLSGIAERNTPAGRKRTAVISAADQMYLVGEGETVGGRYSVVRIDPEAVLLRDQTGAEITLALR